MPTPVLKPTALGCIDKLTFELDLQFSGFSKTRETRRESVSIRKLKALPEIPSRFLLKFMVPRGDWEIDVFSQVLCDVDQRRVPLRKEEGDEILRKLLTVCMVDVFISSPRRGCLFLPAAPCL